MTRPAQQPQPLLSADRPQGSRRRTGVFGGSFNPIHTGHIALARQLLEQAALAEIWFMVSPLNPFKEGSGNLLDDDLRLELARQALSGEPKLVASDYEFKLPRPSFTWNTLRHLATDYPDREFVLIIGADNWAAFDRWARPDYILSRFELAVYPRAGYPIDPASLPDGVHLMTTALYPVSSTEIRRRVKAGEPIDGLVPPEIRDSVVRLYG